MKKLLPIFALLLVGVIGFGLYHAASTGKQSPIILSGVVKIDPFLQNKILSQNTLFLVLYDQDSPMPMPFGAVKERVDTEKLKSGEIEFLITREKIQLMNENAPNPKNFRFKARIDLDGMGGRDQVGDMTGELKGLAFGTSNVTLNINQLVE